MLFGILVGLLLVTAVTLAAKTPNMVITSKSDPNEVSFVLFVSGCRFLCKVLLFAALGGIIAQLISWWI